jgi:hypothetical protein
LATGKPPSIWPTCEHLADLLAERGDLDGLRAGVIIGGKDATAWPASMLSEGEGAQRLRRFGLNPDGSTDDE